MNEINDTASYSRGGLGQMQQDALKLGSRVRQQSVEGKADFAVTVFGPNGRKIASFFIANSTQDEAEMIAKKQISFRLSPAA